MDGVHILGGMISSNEEVRVLILVVMDGVHILKFYIVIG